MDDSDSDSVADSQTTDISNSMNDSDIESVDDSHSILDKTVDNSETVDNTNECDDTDCYPVSFLQRLQGFRLEGHLVDVILCAEGKEIPCHRLVLSACSDYFHAMFGRAHSESKKDKIEIGGVSAESLQQLVDYAYTSKITVTMDNVQPLYEAANMLQVKGVEDKCEKFLTDKLSHETCLVTWALADKVSCEPLLERAKLYTLKHFEDVCMKEEFLELPVDFLKSCISDDGLHAKNEERVLEVVLRWVRHDLKERQSHLKELLECVRFSQVDQEFLKGIMETDKVLAGISGIKELMQDQSRYARPRHIQGEILVFGGRTCAYTQGDEGNNYNMYKLTLNCDCVDSSPFPPYFFHINAACVVNSDVFITGGAYAKCYAYRYKPSVGSWSKLGPLVNEERLFNSMVALQGQAYIVGGIGMPNWRAVYDVEVYSESTDMWSLVAPLLNKGVKDFGLASCCDKIFVFGGKTGKCTLSDQSHNTDAVQCYDPTQNVWTYTAPLPNPMEEITACTVNSKIYLVGGKLAHVLCYDPQQDCYEKMTNPLASWFRCSATTCGSDIYIIGGCDHNYTAPLPNPMEEITACTVNSKIYLVGGKLAHVLCYDPQQDCYEKMTNPLASWFRCSATTCGSDIYIIGGCDHNDDDDDKVPHATVQRYNVRSNTMVLLKDFPVTIFQHISVIVPKA
ncbi:kelch-like protein 24 [Branchiostoma floridae]|uniref:Kelch-like protein 24 n=2 Tax=Branchiostoma floridae TaxID=7739 RepID=A0A9J7MDN0_BRAFL|nr:kelch-like protein 24 [Branchiostoma floridae]